MNHSKIVCVDLEMCCWVNRPPGDIIEVGLVEVDLSRETITRNSQYYVLPFEDEVSQFCTGMTGITPAKLEKCGKPLDAVIQSWYSRYGSSTTYCAWGRDDLVLQKHCDRHGLNSPIKEFINISSLYMMMQRHTGKRIPLSQALEHYNVQLSGRAHSALVDSVALAELILKIL